MPSMPGWSRLGELSGVDYQETYGVTVSVR